MRETRKKQKVLFAAWAVVCSLVMLAAAVIGGDFAAPVAYAEEGKTYTDVSDDLQKD